MTRAVVIGLGNTFRRDDGVGPAVAAAVEGMGLAGVRVVCPGESAGIIDAWDGAALAVVVDAAAGGTPGRVRQCDLDALAGETPVSSHELSLRQTHDLARVLDRAPGRVVVVSVDVADTGYGMGLSAAVAAALPDAVRVVERVLGEQVQETRHQQP